LAKNRLKKNVEKLIGTYYINKNMSIKVKVNSVSSAAFHETGLKEIITEVIKPYVKAVVSGENTNETTCLYVELYKDKLTISISLAGQPLYKRGYRGKLSKSAPLREDIAACCIQQALLFSKNHDQDFTPNTILIPFSGTGTFAFEYMQSYFKFMPALLLREYALEEMTLFKKDNFSSLVKKSKEYCTFSKPELNENSIKIACIDKSVEASAALEDNLQCFKNIAEKNNFRLPEITNIQNDFFSINPEDFSGNIFIPLNPPYGIRLEKDSNSILFYKKIACKINDIFKIAEKNQRNVLGFVLCPNEETWSSFMKNLKLAKTDTYHFTQGGLDIRVCQFFA